jgi:TRAP-type C4-dicarboxylate transport system permease small subunit
MPAGPPATAIPASLGRRALGLARTGADIVAAVMFAAVFVIFCAKIVARYGEHAEMAWADEVSSILFIWIIFWANAFILRERDHIRFDLVTHAVPPTARRWMAIARGVLFAYVAPGTIDYILFLWRERTPVLGLRLDYVYMCFGIFIVTVPLQAAWSVVRLCGRHWRLHI